MASTKKTFPYGQHQVTIETGEIARQAGGAVLVSMAETVVLVAAVAKTEASDERDFFPLTVNYQEKTYAAGRIPGGFFKREGRPTEKETLVSRLIDRPIRPLFPKGFVNEVQVIATVISLNPEVDSDIPAMLGASAALALTGAPFAGPIGGARVGYIDGNFVLNPTTTQLKQSKLDLVVAGTAKAVLMVESAAQQLSGEGDARCRDLRPRADADRDREHSCAGRRSRSPVLELDGTGCRSRRGRCRCQGRR